MVNVPGPSPGEKDPAADAQSLRVNMGDVLRLKHGVKDFDEKKKDLDGLSKDELAERLNLIHLILKDEKVPGEKRKALKTNYPVEAGWRDNKGEWNSEALKNLWEAGRELQQTKGWAVPKATVDIDSNFQELSFFGKTLQLPFNEPETILKILTSANAYIDDSKKKHGVLYNEDIDEFNLFYGFIQTNYENNSEVMNALAGVLEHLNQVFPNPDAPSPPAPEGDKGTKKVESKNPADPFDEIRTQYLALKPGSSEYNKFWDKFNPMADKGNPDAIKIIAFEKRLDYLKREKDKKSPYFAQRLAELKHLRDTPYENLPLREKEMADRFYPGFVKEDYEAFLSVLEAGKDPVSETPKDRRIAELERLVSELQAKVSKLEEPAEVARREAEKKKLEQERKHREAREAQERAAEEERKNKELERELQAELLENIVEECSADIRENVRIELKALSDILNHPAGTNARLVYIQKQVAKMMYEILPESVLTSGETGKEKAKSGNDKKANLEALRNLPPIQLRKGARNMAAQLLDRTEESMGAIIDGYVDEFITKTSAPKRPEYTPITMTLEPGVAIPPAAPETSATAAPAVAPVTQPVASNAVDTPVEHMTHDFLAKIPGIETDPALSESLKTLIDALNHSGTGLTLGFKTAQRVLGNNVRDILGSPENQRFQNIKALLLTNAANEFVKRYKSLIPPKKTS